MPSGLDLFPSGVRRARKGIYEVKKQMMTGSEAWSHSRRRTLKASKQYETLLKTMLENTVNM